MKTIVQHVPKNWFKLKSNKENKVGKCWFPFTKSEFPNAKISFKTHQVEKMIRDCYTQNTNDGKWFNAQKISGPFGEFLNISV